MAAIAEILQQQQWEKQKCLSIQLKSYNTKKHVEYLVFLKGEIYLSLEIHNEAASANLPHPSPNLFASGKTEILLTCAKHSLFQLDGRLLQG